MTESTAKFRSRATRFIANDDGTWVFDDDFGYDAALEITGDFAEPKERVAYAQAVAVALNAAEIPVAPRP